MRGKNVFFPMGYDDNGLPTERFVEKKHKINKSKISRKDFIKLCVEETKKTGQTYYDLLPSYYQHMTELGYYGFDIEHVKDLLKVVLKPTNLRFAPKNVDLTYNSKYISEVRDFAENKGKKILYIYGEYDTWGACAPNPKPHVDALKMILQGGSHSTRIKDFSEIDQQIIYEKLQNWLGYSVKIYPLEK